MYPYYRYFDNKIFQAVRDLEESLSERISPEVRRAVDAGGADMRKYLEAQGRNLQASLRGVVERKSTALGDYAVLLAYAGARKRRHILSWQLGGTKDRTTKSGHGRGFIRALAPAGLKDGALLDVVEEKVLSLMARSILKTR